MKKSERWHTYWLFLAIIALCLVACNDNDNPSMQNEMTAPAYDPSVPVTVSDFLPKEGGMGQRLVIYGQNFGNDAKLVQVTIGGKKAIVISANGESLYCLVPQKAIEGTIEVTVGEEGNSQKYKAEEKFTYERKLVVTTLAGYKNSRDDQGWKEGKFKDPDESKMAAIGNNYGWLRIDPVNPKHMWFVYDGNDGLYLMNFEDSTITRRRGGFDRPRAIDFTLDGKYMLVAEDRGGDNDRNILRLSRERNFEDTEVITRFKQCNTVAVHPKNGEMYYNSYSKGQVFRFDLNKYFEEGGVQDKVKPEELFLVHDQDWEFRIIIHPTGNYAYIVVVNKHYILRMDYNWEKARFNQPYVVAGTIGKWGYEDGVGTSALFDQPYQGVFVKNKEYEAAGKEDIYDFYIADRANHAIRKLTTEGAVTTFAGRGSSSINPEPKGYVNGDLREEARFDEPTGIAYSEAEEAFYIIDSRNKRIRKIALEEMDDELAAETGEE